MWAESDGAPKQEDETSRREDARIAALEKLTRSGPEQKKRRQTAMKRIERQAAAPVRIRWLSTSFMFSMRCDLLRRCIAWWLHG